MIASLFEALGNARMLSAADRRFFVGAWLLAPVVEVAKPGREIDRTLDRLVRIPRFGGSRRNAERGVGVERGEAMVRAAFARHPAWVKRGCLPESVAQYVLHSVVGPPPRLVIGVRKVAPEGGAPSDDGSLGGWGLGAHAWVEEDGGPSRAGEFEPIVAVSARGVWRASGARA